MYLRLRPYLEQGPRSLPGQAPRARHMEMDSSSVLMKPQRCFYLKHLFCCLPNFLALNTSPAVEQSRAG